MNDLKIQKLYVHFIWNKDCYIFTVFDKVEIEFFILGKENLKRLIRICTFIA